MAEPTVYRDTWSSQSYRGVARELCRTGPLDIGRLAAADADLGRKLEPIDRFGIEGEIDTTDEFLELAQLPPGDFVHCLQAAGHEAVVPAPLRRLLAGDAPMAVRMPDGSFLDQVEPQTRGIEAGSFNPRHEGHRQLLAAAEKTLQGRVVYEISLHNTDKPDLNYLSLRARAEQFDDRPVVFTAVPTFLEKARIFPRTVFVVGVDTAERLLSPERSGGEEAMREVLDGIEGQGCSFLVAARAEDGQLRTLADLRVPDGYQEMFREIPVKDFRVDVSSTAIRHQHPNGLR